MIKLEEKINRRINPRTIMHIRNIVAFLILQVQIGFYIILSLVRVFLPKVPKSVKGEVVLITGGGHGIGKELALLYAKEGATVIVWDINVHNGEETVKEIGKKGYGRAYFFKCDVSKSEEVFSVAKLTEAKAGAVTILINNAGIMKVQFLLKQTPADIQNTLNINVLAHFWTLQAFLPSMKKYNHGHIVSISSTAGIMGVPKCVAYCASKFAVRGLMESLHEELRVDQKSKIKITNISPFFVKTGLCKDPEIRLQELMPMLEPQEAAQQIMDAQRRDLLDVTIPKYLSHLNAYSRILPLGAQLSIVDFLGFNLIPDSE